MVSVPDARGPRFLRRNDGKVMARRPCWGVAQPALRGVIPGKRGPRCGCSTMSAASRARPGTQGSLRQLVPNEWTSAS